MKRFISLFTILLLAVAITISPASDKHKKVKAKDKSGCCAEMTKAKTGCSMDAKMSKADCKKECTGMTEAECVKKCGVSSKAECMKKCDEMKAKKTSTEKGTTN